MLLYTSHKLRKKMQGTISKNQRDGRFVPWKVWDIDERNWRRQINAYRLERLILLQCPYYPKQSTDSVQSLLTLVFFWDPTQRQQNENHVGLHQTKELLHSEENHRWNEKANYRMGEDSFHLYKFPPIHKNFVYLQNIQRSHTITKNNQMKNGQWIYMDISPKTHQWLRGTWKRCSTSLIKREIQIKTTMPPPIC